MDKVDFPLSMSLTDAILTINGNGFTAESYETTGKSIASFTPPTSPRALIARDSMRNRDKSKFFCFAGNGFVRKGVDLVVEAFLDMPNLTLTLAGPSTDDLFWRIYGERIRSSPNIDFIGFIEAGGERYREICQSHAWSIMAAACEGVSTSVATTMRSGLLPVVTYETAVRTDDFGFLLPTDPSQIIKYLRELGPRLGTWDESDYETRVDACLIASEDYTEASYIRSVTDALSEILRSENVVKQ
jgi:glycosyltransferase involved in cell wall biosynthesis